MGYGYRATGQYGAPRPVQDDQDDDDDDDKSEGQEDEAEDSNAQRPKKRRRIKTRRAPCLYLGTPAFMETQKYPAPRNLTQLLSSISSCAQELLQDAAKARIRRMVMKKKKRSDLEVPDFVRAEWAKGGCNRGKMAELLLQLNGNKDLSHIIHIFKVSLSRFSY